MKQIIFAAVNQTELIDTPVIQPNDNEVLVKTAFSTISCGTERANLTGSTNVGPVSYTHLEQAEKRIA